MVSRNTKVIKTSVQNASNVSFRWCTSILVWRSLVLRRAPAVWYEHCSGSSSIPGRLTVVGWRCVNRRADGRRLFPLRPLISTWLLCMARSVAVTASATISDAGWGVTVCRRLKLFGKIACPAVLLHRDVNVLASTKQKCSCFFSFSHSLKNALKPNKSSRNGVLFLIAC